MNDEEIKTLADAFCNELNEDCGACPFADYCMSRENGFEKWAKESLKKDVKTDDIESRSN